MFSLTVSTVRRKVLKASVSDKNLCSLKSASSKQLSRFWLSSTAMNIDCKAPQELLGCSGGHCFGCRGWFCVNVVMHWLEIISLKPFPVKFWWRFKFLNTLFLNYVRSPNMTYNEWFSWCPLCRARRKMLQISFVKSRRLELTMTTPALGDDTSGS